MQSGSIASGTRPKSDTSSSTSLWRYFEAPGRLIFRLFHTADGLVAFALITLGVAVTKFRTSARVVHPLIRHQIHRAGLGLLPLTGFLACATSAQCRS